MVAVKLAPVARPWDLGRCVSREQFWPRCSSPFTRPSLSHGVCTFVPWGGRQRCKCKRAFFLEYK